MQWDKGNASKIILKGMYLLIKVSSCYEFHSWKTVLFYLQGDRGFPGSPGIPGFEGRPVSLDETEYSEVFLSKSKKQETLVCINDVPRSCIYFFVIVVIVVLLHFGSCCFCLNQTCNLKKTFIFIFEKNNYFNVVLVKCVCWSLNINSVSFILL